MTFSDRLELEADAILAEIRGVLDADQIELVSDRLATLSGLGARVALGEDGASAKAQIVLAGLNQMRAGAGVRIGDMWAQRFSRALSQVFASALAAVAGV